MIKIMHRYIVAIVYLLFSTAGNNINGQSLANIAFERLTINDGLSQGMVNKIIQDKYGFMWFATKDGLNRYDGYHFKVYRHDPQDAKSIIDGHVQTLMEDSRGRIWAGTSSGRLELFDHNTETFRHIMLERDSIEAATTGPLQQLIEDKEGNIWALCLKHAYVLEMQHNTAGISITWQVKKISIPFSQQDNKLFISKNGTIYFYNIFNPHIYTWNQNQHWAVWNEGSDFIAGLNKNNSFLVYRLLEDSVSSKLYMVCSAGIVQFENKLPPKIILAKPMSMNTNCFLEKTGNIWFNGEKQFGVYNLNTGKIFYIGSGDKQMQYHLTLIQSTYVDRSGMIWMGTGGYGIITLDPWTERFHHLDKSSIFYFKEREDGKMMVNNGNNSFNTIDINSGTYTDSYPFPGAKKIFENFTDFSYPSFTDSFNCRWFADDKRLLCYNQLTKKATSYPLPVTLSSFNYGLSMALCGDGRNIIWVGGSEGLLCFNNAEKTWKIYRNNSADPNSLSFNVVFTICYDPIQPGRFLWVGTNGGGLNRLEIKTGKFKRYTLQDGLPNNVVYGVLPDDDRRLWMSTNKGISCFNPATEKFENFEEKDGLQSNEFNHNAYVRGSNGILYFGGVNGFNYFNPREVSKNSVIPKIAFTNFRIRNQPVSSGDPNSPLRSPVYMTKKIELPYSDNMFSFEFAALDFTAPQRNQYKYMMEGFDKDWISSGNINTATYTNLDPGNYTFRVKGSNKDGLWNETGASIQLTILPPWYRTWWFTIVVAITCLTLAYSFYKYRLNRALELMSIRNRIASDLHDEIGSNLSNISIFSNVAQQQQTSSPQVDSMLGKISEYTQTSMEAMNDIVWMINSRNDRFENIMVRMRTLASELFEATNCNLHIDFNERLNNVKLDMQERKNFYLVFKEAINNIAKYADCKDVWIKMTLKNKHVVLLVKDNGRGFDPGAARKGNGLYNMKTRAAQLKGTLEIHTVQGQGTEIMFSFPV